MDLYLIVKFLIVISPYNIVLNLSIQLRNFTSGMAAHGAVYRMGLFSMHASTRCAARSTAIINGFTSPFAILVSTKPNRIFVI
jgi:hypothetical protein